MGLPYGSFQKLFFESGNKPTLIKMTFSDNEDDDEDDLYVLFNTEVT